MVNRSGSTFLKDIAFGNTDIVAPHNKTYLLKEFSHTLTWVSDSGREIVLLTTFGPDFKLCEIAVLLIISGHSKKHGNGLAL
jgi:hypothetical protein